MRKAILTSWPLFFGLSLLMMGNGLQNTLLGVRASLESFDTTAIGIIMSFYFVGFLIGSRYIPRLVVRVGHIRVFAAMASIASTTVLFHGLFTDPYIWVLARVLTGFSFAGLFIVIESWLNNITTNKIRGKMLAMYLIVLYSSMVTGQFMLLAADPSTMELFVMVSVLVSIALLPISLSSRPAPHFEKPQSVSMKDLYKSSPLGVLGVTVSGLANATLFGMGAVYGEKAGFSLSQISIFMSAFIAGGVIFQSPIGWLSDRYDRRRVLIGVSFVSALLCVASYFAADISFAALLFTMLLLGGAALSIYALALAHTNDHLTSSQIIAASASLLMANSIGACFGPVLCSFLMDYFGTDVFYPFLMIVFLIITVFGIYRVFRRAPVPLAEQSDHMAVVPETTPLISMQIAEQSGETLKKMK